MISSVHNFLFHRNADKCLSVVFGFLATCVASLVALIVIFLLLEASAVITSSSLREFLFGSDWSPADKIFGMAAMIVATLGVAGGATALALPFGIVCAAFMVFIAPRSALFAMKILMALLVGTPSVVFGLWGLTAVVPLISTLAPPGTSLLSAVLVLAFMILPTITLTSYSAFASLPKSLIRASFSLGLGLKSHVLLIALPAARSGILAGVILALTRALGETMAVLMVAGNVSTMPTSIFDPVRVLTANIALELSYASGDHRTALYASGLLLALLILLLSVVAHRFGKETHHD